jgi:leucyl/phenylalanyl-tRNA--protein transferase
MRIQPSRRQLNGSHDCRLSASRFFPPANESSPDGLLYVGGELSPEWLLDAYSHGIFPWPIWSDVPMAWWSLDPRAVLELDQLHVSRRLRRTIRSGKFQATCDRDFAGVIHGCATASGRRGETWLTPAMIDAYSQMHQLGHAHSVEVWHEGRLAGGTYGIAIGGFFAGESMFYRQRDASKVALVCLVAHLRARGYQLLDVQQWTEHTGRMGVIEIPRAVYLRRLAQALELPRTFGSTLEGNAMGF